MVFNIELRTPNYEPAERTMSFPCNFFFAAYVYLS
jgi:hypothetical protein